MFKRYLTIIQNPRYFAFLEQIIISGTTFLALLFFARILSKDAWGAVSISIALFYFAQGFQRALITIPLVTFSPDKKSAKNGFRFWLGEMHKITGGAFIAGTAAFFGCKLLFPDHWIGSALLGLIILVVPHFYYEFVRRYLIQLGLYSTLVSISLVSAIITAFAVATALFFRPSAETAALAYASGAAIAAAIGMRTVRRECASIHEQEHVTDHLDIPKFARWSILSHVAFSSYVIAIPVILGLLAGPAAVAVLTALRNIVQPLNTLLSAVDNFDKPKASRAWKSGGVKGLIATLSHTRRTLILVGGGYLIFVVLLGGEILHFLYAGKYDGNTPVLIAWVVIYFCMLISQPAETGLYIMRKPDLLFRARAISACLGLVAAIAAIPILGVMGAAGGLLVGWACNAVMSQRLLAKTASSAADGP